MLALVLPTKKAALPDICPPLAAALLGRALLEGEPLADRVRLSRLPVAEHFTQIQKVLLGSRAFRQFDLAPFSDEICDRHIIVLMCWCR